MDERAGSREGGWVRQQRTRMSETFISLRVYPLARFRATYSL